MKELAKKIHQKVLKLETVGKIFGKITYWGKIAVIFLDKVVIAVLTNSMIDISLDEENVEK